MISHSSPKMFGAAVHFLSELPLKKKKQKQKKNCSTYYISDIPLALDCPDKGLSAATSLTTGESGAPLKQ